MTNPPPPTTFYKTKCRFCPHEFNAPPFVRYIGAGIDPRLLAMKDALIKHMQDCHPMQHGVILAVTAFRVEDPLLMETFNLLRTGILHSCIRNYPSEADLRHQLATLGCDEAQLEKLMPFVIDLRDYCTESGNYMPAIPEELAALIHVPDLAAGVKV